MSTPLKNRTEVKALINALTAIHTEAIYKDTLAEQIADNLVFRKEVVTTQVGSGAVAVDFVTDDLIELTISGNSTITLSNINQGETKWLRVLKDAAYTISFANATDVSGRKTHINTGVTDVIYQITNKRGDIVAESINIDNGYVEELTFDIGAWDMLNNDEKVIPLPSYIDPLKVVGLSATILNDSAIAGTGTPRLISAIDESTSGGLSKGKIGLTFTTSTWEVILKRNTGTGITWTDYANAVDNRGTYIIKYKL